MIEKLIKEGENEAVEFKKDFDKESIETVSAFANKNGGSIFIGVNDKGRIVGVDIGKETLRKWENEISQNTEPIVIPEIELAIINNKKIIIINIKESPIKPISFKEICYLRVKNSNRKLTPKEVAELHFQTIGSSWDSHPAKGVKLEVIDFEKVKKYIQLANEGRRKKIGEKQSEFLEKSGLVKGNKPTWASILLFGKNPQKFVLQAKVHCGKFKNETIILDDQMIEGDLIDQIEKAMDFIKKHISVRFVITGKPRRDEIWEYPLEALREAIVNAIVHRDYTESSEIQIKIYDDELVIWNPGKLPPGISLEDLYRSHRSILRNKLIAQVFYDVEFIEQWGSGIKRMINACIEQNLPTPKFEEYQGFKVTFRKPFSKDQLLNIGLNERQVEAIKFAESKGSINNKEYQNLNNITKRTATRDLMDLTQRNVFKTIGKGKRGIKYILINENVPKMSQKMSQKGDENK